MSNSRISDVASAENRMKGERRIVVIPEMQEGLKEFTKKLRSLIGVRKIAKGVFIVVGDSEPIRKEVGRISHISFKKVRAIPKMRKKRPDAEVKRTYALVMYHLTNPSPQQKKKVQRLVNRSVSIRLRPGVLLFPYLRAKDNRKYFGTENTKHLLNSKDFKVEISRLNADVTRLTHLRIVGPRSLVLVNESFERMVLRKCDTLSEKTGLLREAVNDPEISTAKLKERYSALSLHYKDSKASFDILQQIMRIELGPPYKRVYDKLLRTRRMIAERN